MKQYIKKEVKIDLENNQYYKGLVLDADELFLTLKDKNGDMVSISIKSIISIKEVSR